MAAKYAASSVLFDIGILVLTLQSEGSSCMDGMESSSYPRFQSCRSGMTLFSSYMLIQTFPRLSRWAIVSILFAAAVIHTLLCACMQACIVSHKDWNLPKIDPPPGRQEIKPLSGQVSLPLWLLDPGVTLQRLGVLCKAK